MRKFDDWKYAPGGDPAIYFLEKTAILHDMLTLPKSGALTSRSRSPSIQLLREREEIIGKLVRHLTSGSAAKVRQESYSEWYSWVVMLLRTTQRFYPDELLSLSQAFGRSSDPDLALAAALIQLDGRAP